METRNSEVATEQKQAIRSYTYHDLEAAYLAGWANSGEGWNGEHPGMAHEREQWAAERDEALRAI